MALDFFYHAWLPHIDTQDIILVLSAEKLFHRLQRLLLLICVNHFASCLLPV